LKVLVLNNHEEALMPCSARKARILLKNNKAKVVRRLPFVIQLNDYSSTGYLQGLTLGVDSGHSTIGLSVTSETKEFIALELQLRNDISSKLETRSMYRRTRRGRLRYRKPRFNNRTRKEGWLPPSVQHKVDSHVKIIKLYQRYLPISKLIIETGSFDMARINNPSIENSDYQKGNQYGFNNVKAYILSRDKYTCQSGKKGCSKELHVHHLVFRSKGGSDNPKNLITLCKKHHRQLHDGKLNINFKKHKVLRSATVMNIIRVYILKELPGAIETFGYITKSIRLENNIEKTHSNDAFVISGGVNQERIDVIDYKLRRRNNRSLQKNRNGFSRSIRRERYYYQPHDVVEYEGKRYVVTGTMNKGKSIQLMIDGKKKTKPPVKLTSIYRSRSMVLC